MAPRPEPPSPADRGVALLAMVAAGVAVALTRATLGLHRLVPDAGWAGVLGAAMVALLAGWPFWRVTRRG